MQSVLSRSVQQINFAYTGTSQRTVYIKSTIYKTSLLRTNLTKSWSQRVPLQRESTK